MAEIASTTSPTKQSAVIARLELGGFDNGRRDLPGECWKQTTIDKRCAFYVLPAGSVKIAVKIESKTKVTISTISICGEGSLSENNRIEMPNERSFQPFQDSRKIHIKKAKCQLEALMLRSRLLG